MSWENGESGPESISEKYIALVLPVSGHRSNSWTKSRRRLKSFPPCYLQSPLQLCLEISFTPNSRNLLQITQFSTIQLLYTVKDKGGNPNRNLKPENSQDCAQRPQRNCTFMNSASGFFWETLLDYGVYTSVIREVTHQQIYCTFWIYCPPSPPQNTHSPSFSTFVSWLLTTPRNWFRQSICPSGPVRQPYSYSVPSPYRLF
jgi:hypothetical protein